MRTDRYDWRGEVRKRLEVEVEDPDTTDPCIASRPVIRALYEHARETLGIPKTPPEPTDEELLDEVHPKIGAQWDGESFMCTGILFREAAKRGTVEVWHTAADDTWHAQVGDLDRARAGTGPTPADALRIALAAYLRAEWRREKGGGE